jgi:hypothetical protein
MIEGDIVDFPLFDFGVALFFFATSRVTQLCSMSKLKTNTFIILRDMVNDEDQLWTN